MDEIIRQLDVQLKAGDIRPAAQKLVTIKPRSVPPRLRREVASLCRRAGLYEHGLRMLINVVVKPLPGAKQASPQEIAEYCGLLMKVGAYEEALQRLDKVDPSCAEGHLFRAFCRMAQWEYDSARSSLETYVAMDVGPYAKLTGQINLLSCLVSLRDFAAAGDLADQLIEEARVHGHNRLQANAVELRSQIFLHQQDWAACERDLDSASALIKSGGGLDDLYIRKWRAILHSLKTKSLSSIQELTAEARRMRHWETLREADFYRLLVDFNQGVFDRLMIGTPFENFRRRLREAHPGAVINEHYKIGHGDKILDLRQGDGKTVHLLLDFLIQDLYRPRSTGEVFSYLFKGEYFNPASAPVRVRQAIFRARKFLEENGHAARITESGGHYRLRAEGGTAIVVSLHRQLESGYPALLKKLRGQWSGETITAKEAQTMLKVSASTVQRMFEWGLESGHFEMVRQGRRVSYRYSKV